MKRFGRRARIVLIEDQERPLLWIEGERRSAVRELLRDLALVVLLVLIFLAITSVANR
jgi:hypothetical protein